MLINQNKKIDQLTTTRLYFYAHLYTFQVKDMDVNQGSGVDMWNGSRQDHWSMNADVQGMNGKMKTTRLGWWDGVEASEGTGSGVENESES